MLIRHFKLHLFPDLNRFETNDERKQAMLQAWSEARMGYWLALSIVALVSVACVAGTFVAMQNILLTIIAPMILLGVLIGDAVWWMRRHAIRRSLRRRLRELGQPVCIECGLDLSKPTTGLCPQCGKDN